MILINTDTITAVFQVQRPFEHFSDYYTILLQNTVTKEIYQYTVKPKKSTNKLFYTFEIDIQNLVVGEYYVLIISNPLELVLEVEYNNVNAIEEDNRVKEILKNNKDILTNDKFILCNEVGKTMVFLMNKGAIITNGDVLIGNTQNTYIKVITKDLLKFGEYKQENKQYNKQTKFITYNG